MVKLNSEQLKNFEHTLKLKCGYTIVINPDKAVLYFGDHLVSNEASICEENGEYYVCFFDNYADKYMKIEKEEEDGILIFRYKNEKIEIIDRVKSIKEAKEKIIRKALESGQPWSAVSMCKEQIKVDIGNDMYLAESNINKDYVLVSADEDLNTMDILTFPTAEQAVKDMLEEYRHKLIEEASDWKVKKAFIEKDCAYIEGKVSYAWQIFNLKEA